MSDGVTLEVLVEELPNRLRGYAAWVGFASTKVVILVDRDDDDCVELKQRLRDVAKQAGLATADSAAAGQVLCAAYPRLPASLGEQAKYRDPDGITGGTWEALERVLNHHGYHPTGLMKLTAASDIAQHMDVESNRSRSFQAFRDGLRRLVNEGSDAQAD